MYESHKLGNNDDWVDLKSAIIQIYVIYLAAKSNMSCNTIRLASSFFGFISFLHRQEFIYNNFLTTISKLIVDTYITCN